MGADNQAEAVGVMPYLIVVAVALRVSPGHQTSPLVVVVALLVVAGTVAVGVPQGGFPGVVLPGMELPPVAVGTDWGRALVAVDCKPLQHRA